ncbi:enediyne antibiotic chromoprotein [Streptomyces sp. ZAF1911]|uniref:enediyne antibiotic chromoprotein n=1 Tax=Streptomyces sp. ZAF1911 TaxID=2944129 RepID=UPI00237AA724|nr:enediyne antibiotic chromoprotein [Streptomyces sp. ZAF1911]MDD9375143.1 enediyne antibiotic chromoprotein [Streptomyces sp. ZAF1911]
MNFKSTRMKVALAAGAALGLSPTATATVSAQARATPHVVVTPAADLPENATVTVELSGFEPESAVFVRQCAQLAPDVRGCDYTNTQSLNLDNEGYSVTAITVHRVFEAHDGNGESIGEVDCAKIKLGCTVSAGHFEAGADASISFAGAQ